MAKLADFTLVEARPGGDYLIDIKVSAGVANQIGWGAKRIDRQLFHLDGTTPAELKHSLRLQVQTFFQATQAKYQASQAATIPPPIAALVGVETALSDDD